MQSPAVTLPGYFYELTKFMNAAKAHYGSNPTDANLEDQLKDRKSKDLFKIYAAGITAPVSASRTMTFYSDNKNDAKGDQIRDQIKDIHTKFCQYSDGGGSISVNLAGSKYPSPPPVRSTAL